MAVVIWLNGPFGVGKTSVARLLLQRLPGARLVDPERIGWVMRRTFWRRSDYQDVALWRWLVARQVTWAARKGPVIVPMTVVERSVLEEVACGARVFALVASRATLGSRIAGDDGARAWRTVNVERCLATFGDSDGDDLGEHVDTEGRTPEEVATAIVERI